MRKVRVFNSDNALVSESTVDADAVESVAQAFLARGYNVLVDDVPAPSEGPPPRATTAAPFGTEDAARRVVNQALADCQTAAQELMSLTLEQTRYWLAVGARVVDEDARRREIVHKALKDLDIADRSIAVLEWQGRMDEKRRWQPDVENDQDGAGIVNLIGAGVKQLLDKKN